MAPTDSADSMTAEAPAQSNDTAKAKPANPNMIKKKDVYDHVTVATGLRKREVREAVDATFAYFHKCLAEGKDLQVPPLGKIKSITKGEGADKKLHHKLVLQKSDAEKKDAAEAKEALEAAED